MVEDTICCLSDELCRGGHIKQPHVDCGMVGRPEHSVDLLIS